MQWHLFQFNKEKNFIISQPTNLLHNVNMPVTYTYTIQTITHVMGAKGAGNPIGLMGSLADDLYTLFISAGLQGAFQKHVWALKSKSS